MKINLSAREQKVLWATINHYIATAEPVGSKALAEEYKFDISAATIRSVMGMLDKSGFLYQPHTSAGRIPSDSGYRVYVDKIVDLNKELNYSCVQYLTQKFESLPNQNLEVLLRNVAQILATFSGCIALITAPNMQTARLKHLQLVMVEAPTVMLIAVMDSYHTASVMMKLPEDFNAQSIATELEILNNFLNAHLRDRPLKDLTSLKWDDLDQQFQHYAQLLKQSLQELNQICNPPPLGQIFISGLTELLRQPEFTQLNQVQAIIQLLEEDQASLFPLIFEPKESSLAFNQSSAQNQLTIKIGSEISLEPIQRCSLISSTYSCDDVQVGSVGILGPTRLDYELAIASVQTIAIHLSETLSQRP